MKKKIVLAVVSLISVLIMGVMFAACATNVVGTYKFVSSKMTIGTQVQEYKVGDTSGSDTITEDYMVLEIKEDKTFALTQPGYTQTGTWEQDGQKVILSYDGIDQKTEATVSGNTLTMTSTYTAGSSTTTIEVTLKK